MATSAELAGMHLAYGTADCNEPAAQRLHAKRYPTRRIPNHNSFASLHQKLVEIDSFQKAGRERLRIARTPVIEQNVLQQFAGDCKYEYVYSSVRSQGFSFQHLRDSPRTRRAPVSREANPVIAIG